MQRLRLSRLNDIAQACGYDPDRVEFGSISYAKQTNGMDDESKGSFWMRFGYWDFVDVDRINRVLPPNMKAILHEIDDDDDTGRLAAVQIKFQNAAIHGALNPPK